MIKELDKNNVYLKNAELIRAISRERNVDMHVACKMFDLMSPAEKDQDACSDFLHECNRIGLDAVIDTYAR